MPAPSAGNDSAMRTAPLGLWLYDNPAALAQAAHFSWERTARETLVAYWDVKRET
jgi:ADP-ribosylglycohydrolase